MLSNLFSHIKLVPSHSPLFPNNLKTLPDCPEVLFVMGDENILNSFGVSIIGTRNSSEDGNQIAYQFAKELAEKDVVVISGMATGIDSQAHLGAASVGKTIAIVACGFYHLKSSQNIFMVNQIIANGGAVISEYFPDAPPQKYSFLHRNRLIAALCHSLLVIEAPEKSGATYTATLALQLQKPVFVIPWGLHSFRGSGSNKLTEKGAHFLTNSTQWFDFLKNTFPEKLVTPTFQEAIANSSSQLALKKSKSTSQKTSPKKNDLKNSIAEPYRALYQCIQRFEPISKEEIYSHFPSISIAELNATLLLMELEHFIVLKR